MSELTKSEIISKFKCSHCPHMSENTESPDRFQNIINVDITAPSVVEIISLARMTMQSGFLKRCENCDKLNLHSTE